MASQLVAVRSANERLLLSAMIPPPNAPGLMFRVSTARQGTTAIKLVFEEIAALGATRKGAAEGTDQFFSGMSMSVAGSGRAANRLIAANNVMMPNASRFIQSVLL